MGDDGKKVGLSAAVKSVSNGIEPPEPVKVQLPLPVIGALEPLGAQSEHAGLQPGPGDGGVSEAGAQSEGEVDARRGPGRPPGATNRRTQDWVDYILARYRSPLIVLAEMFSRPVGQLAKELDCTRAEALRYQIAAAKELAPYVHAKMPVAVQIDGKGVVQLVIETVGEVAKPITGEDDGSVHLDAEVIDVEMIDAGRTDTKATDAEMVDANGIDAEGTDAEMVEESSEKS